MSLATYASNPAYSRGRFHLEARDEVRGPRDAFQRDRDRIIHSTAFRRLRGKTQVFVAPDGDHFRVRLTHSMEVAQIGRAMARALNLNEDLTEALCLAHDIGHPPFGHAGEEALQMALANQGGFDHNAQTLRMLTKLEQTYPSFDGLNLTWETLEGLAKHNGPVTDPPWALSEIDEDYALELDSFASLEAQIAALADDIAYDNHDIDDGMRAGLIERDALLALPMAKRIWDRAEARFPDAGEDLLVSELVREQIGEMVNDVLEETTKRVTEANVDTVDDVRQAGAALATFSDEMAKQERDLKSFLYSNLYHDSRVTGVSEIGQNIVAGLFAAFRDDMANLPADWRAKMPADEPQRSRHIADFIAGMTDGYAIRSYREIIGPVELPEGF